MDKNEKPAVKQLTHEERMELIMRPPPTFNVYIGKTAASQGFLHYEASAIPYVGEK